jgi:hypothetical protein
VTPGLHEADLPGLKVRSDEQACRQVPDQQGILVRSKIRFGPVTWVARHPGALCGTWGKIARRCGISQIGM